MPAKLTVMQVFSFGGKAPEHPLEDLPLDHVGDSALRFMSFPVATSGYNHDWFF